MLLLYAIAAIFSTNILIHIDAVYEVEGKAVQSELILAYPVVSAFLSDTLEEKHLENCQITGGGSIITFVLPAFSVRTLLVERG